MGGFGRTMDAGDDGCRAKHRNQRWESHDLYQGMVREYAIAQRSSRRILGISCRYGISVDGKEHLSFVSYVHYERFGIVGKHDRLRLGQIRYGTKNASFRYTGS